MRQLDIIRAGELRSRVTFYIRTAETEQDTTGFVPELNSSTDLSTWVVRGTDIPALIEDERGLEIFEGKRDISANYSRLTIRYDPDMQPEQTDVVVCDGTRYDIQNNADINQRHKKVQFLIREVK